MKPSLSLSVDLMFLIMCFSTLARGQANLETRATEASRALIEGHIAWKTKLSTPGASIQAKEVTRTQSLVMYNLYVSGLPTNQLYKLMTWPVGNSDPFPMMQGVRIGKNGIAICAMSSSGQCGDSSRMDDAIQVVFRRAKGEPFRLALVAGDHRATVVIVPDPITGEDKGCTLRVERLLPQFELAYFTGSGFPAHSDVLFDSQSYDEKHEIRVATDRDGTLRFALMPLVSGKQEGTTTVTGMGMRCAPSVKFSWGE